MGRWEKNIVDILLKNISNYINNYYEPFVGGGALLYQISNLVKNVIY